MACNLHKQATHFPRYNQVEAIITSGIQLVDAELSEDVRTSIASAVSSLDSITSTGLDKLTTTVPTLSSPTDKILPISSATDYIVGFSLVQSSLKLADAILGFFGISTHMGGPSAEDATEVTPAETEDDTEVPPAETEDTTEVTPAKTEDG